MLKIRPCEAMTFKQIPKSRMRHLGRVVTAGREAAKALADPGLDLPPEECRRLRDAVVAGQSARQELILGNIPLALRFGERAAGEGRNRYHEADDSIGDALVGLVIGAGLYDPDRYGTEFSTSTSWQIRGQIGRGRMRLRPHDPLPGGRKVHRGVGLDVDPDRLPALADVPGDDPERRREAEIASRSLLATLPDRDRAMVERRYGIGGEAPMTLAEIGREFGVSKQRAGQLVDRAILRLKARAWRGEASA